MKKALLLKEFALAMHPTAPVFLLLAAMLLIPNYPYYVVFFYTTLSVFFTCLSGRENGDVAYTLMLPVAKADVVGSRFAYVSLLQLAQVAMCVPFIFLRRALAVPENVVGMEANAALLGLGLVLYGLFDLVFFGIYYKNVRKVGKAFVVASIAVFVFICLAEAAVHVLPAAARLDSTDGEGAPGRLIFFAVCALLWAGLKAWAFRRAKRDFQKQDL
ncbi:MAG: ABC-2 transporter permease [Christensenellaceae bacterium]|nr:ABC-2 transporter permease [Christensenellaceae bacterium]